MIAYFNRFTITMTKAQARDCSHQGACEWDVINLIRSDSRIRRQLRMIPDDVLAAELREYGGEWDDEELADREMNDRRIVWIAAVNIRYEMSIVYPISTHP